MYFLIFLLSFSINQTYVSTNHTVVYRNHTVICINTTCIYRFSDHENSFISARKLVLTGEKFFVLFYKALYLHTELSINI